MNNNTVNNPFQPYCDPIYLTFEQAKHQVLNNTVFRNAKDLTYFKFKVLNK